MNFTFVLTCTNARERECRQSLYSLSQLQAIAMSLQVQLVGSPEQAPLLQQLAHLGSNGQISARSAPNAQLDQKSFSIPLNEILSNNPVGEGDYLLITSAGTLFAPDFLVQLRPTLEQGADVIKLSSVHDDLITLNPDVFDQLKASPYSCLSGPATVVYRCDFLRRHGITFSDHDTVLSSLFALQAARLAASSGRLASAPAAKLYPAAQIINPVSVQALGPSLAQIQAVFTQDHLPPTQAALLWAGLYFDLLRHSDELSQLPERLHLCAALTAHYESLHHTLSAEAWTQMNATLAQLAPQLPAALAEQDQGTLLLSPEHIKLKTTQLWLNVWREQSRAYERAYRTLQQQHARPKPKLPVTKHPIYLISPLCHQPLYEDMYERYFRHNSFVTSSKQIKLRPIYTEPFDGYLTRAYNSFLDHYNYARPAWFVFVHCDFEITCDLTQVLAAVDPNTLLGPSGAIVRHYAGKARSIFVCHCDCQARQGAGFQGGPINLQLLDDAQQVDTLDSCCLVVHSSLIEHYQLRFDPNIVLDFVVEELCAHALSQHGIKTKLIALKGIHHTNSTGDPNAQSERFYRTRDYVAAKYPDLCLAGTCSIVGGTPLEKLSSDKR